jgi:RNA polymerase sigma-70 factor (ECF subfamily)
MMAAGLSMTHVMLSEGSAEASASFESDVIRRIRGGDVDAFEALVERHRQRVFAIVGRHLPHDRVPEVAHDVFVAAFQGLASFRGDKPFGHWLARIAVRRCCDFWRAQGRRREQAISALTDDQRAWMDGVLAAPSREAFEEQVARGEARDVVAWALGQLGAKDRMVVTLVHLQGYSVKEASDLLGWSVPNTKIRAMRARHALRKILSKVMEGVSR